MKAQKINFKKIFGNFNTFISPFIQKGYKFNTSSRRKIMNYELEIAFDFKNSKEYFVRYEPIELTDSEKIPEKLKNKKLYVFEKVKPKAKKYRNISA